MKKQSVKSSGKSRGATTDINATKPEPAQVVTPEPVKRPKWHILWRRDVLLGVGIVCLVLAVWFLCGILFAKINVDGVNLSGRSANAALQRVVAEKTADYRLNLIYPDGKAASFKLADMGIQADTAATVTDIRKAQHGFGQRTTWWQPVVMKLNAKVDAQAWDTFVNQHARIVTKPAQDAALSIVDGTVKITPEADGRQIGLNDASKTLLDRVTKLLGAPLHLHSIVLKPNITQASLAVTKAQLGDILGQSITVTIGDQTVKSSAKDIGSWITLTPTSTGVTISTNEGNIKAYLAGLASSKSVAPRNQVISDTTGQVLTTGAKGVAVGGTPAATAKINQDLLLGKGVQVSLTVSYTAFNTVHAPTSTGKWIEVNTTTKRMYAYDQTGLVRTFLISAGAPGTPTPTGSFKIFSKLRSQDMTGPNLDGTRYFQPAVPYVNYFSGANAIHGNYWRPASYFGNINSSHGCVGLPVGDSAWVYDWAPIGTPVVVHY